MSDDATPGNVPLSDQLGPVPERAVMRTLEVEFVRGALHLNGKPAQEWIDLADSEGTRAVNYLRRARKAEGLLRELAQVCIEVNDLTPESWRRAVLHIGNEATIFLRPNL